MRIKLFGVLTAALIVYAGAPVMAHAELSGQQKTQITAAVDAAMSTGDTGPLQALLTTIVKASPDDAAAVATQAIDEIQKVQAANPGQTLDGSTTTIAEAVTTATVVAIVSAAPGQAGNVSDAVAQADLPSDLLATALQAALSPAAGGTPQQNANGGNGTGNTGFNPVSQTAEIPRRITASPSS